MSSESIGTSDGDGSSLTTISSIESSGSAPQENASSSTANNNHKRSLSGSLLARFQFLRSAPDSHDAANKNEHGASRDGNTVHSKQGAAAVATLPKKGRPRKSSLRKTALLGGKRLPMGHRGPSLETIVSPRLDTSFASNNADASNMQFSPESDDSPTPRASYDKGSTVYATPNGVNGHSTSGLSSDENLPMTGLSRKPALGDISTTDEEETAGAPRTGGAVGSGAAALKAMPEDSYFSLDSNGTRRRPVMKAKSPLSTIPVETARTPEEWDYSETEWWGWIILIVTWVVFVVGMGSCFEVWSWAWDVGETPYAPPELEDDPTLPIVGYYPALIILTGVMAWVWVVVAWVGMKYFKHAKMSSEGV